MPSPPITLSPEQERALRAVRAWYPDAAEGLAPPVFKLAGFAGTGKTTILPFIIEALGLDPGQIAAAAPTGKAALVMDRRLRSLDLPIAATTVHKAIYHPPPLRERTQRPEEGEDEEDSTLPGATVTAPKPPSSALLPDDELRFTLNAESYVAQSRLVVIDEASMVGERIAEDLLSYGVPVLAIGDPGQLPPVNGAPGFAMTSPDAMLTEVHRQARDNPIIALSMWIREGRALAPASSWDGRVHILPWASWNKDALLSAVLCPSTRLLCGTNRTRWDLTAWLRRAQGYDSFLPLSGEPVLCCANDRLTGLVNGSEGTASNDAYNPGRHAYNVVLFRADFPEPEGDRELRIASHRRHFDEHYFRKRLPRPDSREGLGSSWRLGRLQHFDWGWVLTTHKCVATDTLVETENGLQRIADIPAAGWIGGTEGLQVYDQKFQYDEGPLLEITTEYGYRLKVTPNHGLSAWTGTAYERVEASDLMRGQFLRLRRGTAWAGSTDVPPPPRYLDSRTMRHTIPDALTPDLGEFLGLMVGDGTLYKSGFRLAKRHPEVVARFVSLCYTLFGANPRHFQIGNTPAAEVSSTQLVKWLDSFQGLQPHAKAIPREIINACPDVQAAFLRGLWEDGSVSDRDTTIELNTVSEELCRTVQLLLLRIGVISRIRAYNATWRVMVNGADVKLFAQRIGFISTFKTNRINSRAETTYSRALVPVDPSRFPWESGLKQYLVQNLRQNGYVTRSAAAKLDLWAELAFHHDRIASIKPTTGPSMCVSVPASNRFLQNGFDGWNSQGSQWDNVIVVDESGVFRQDAQKWLYTATTRASERLVVFV